MRVPAVCLLLLCACGDGYVERPSQVRYEVGSEDFWALPWPSELRKEADGTLDFERYPGKRNALVTMWLKAADKRLTEGFPVTTGGFFQVNGSVDPATLPSPESSTTDAASVYLVDVDAQSPERGRRFPLWVDFTAESDPYAAERLLAAVPVFGFLRNPNTTYAFVVTDAVKDAAGKPLGRARAFHDAFAKLPKGDAALSATLEPLRAQLALEKKDAARVVAATVFRTMDPSKALRALAAFVEGLPQPTLLTPWVVKEDYPRYQVLNASYLVPQVQTGDRPGQGPIVWDAQGRPVQQGTQEVKLCLTVPKQPMPAAGFPLMLYLHGSGGEWYESVDRGPRGETSVVGALPPSVRGEGPADVLARRGIAALGFDFPLHGNRKTPPDTSGLELYDLFGDIDLTIDNFTVSPMEVVYLSRLVNKMTVPANLAATLNAGGAADGLIRFDPEKLTAMGHSMGSSLGIPVASVDPRIKGYVFSGAGGMLIELANSSTYPVVFKPTLELLLGFPKDRGLRRSHPLLHMFQALWDYADPTTRAPFVAKAPHPGKAPVPFLMTAGIIDGYFHPLAENAVAIALGATQTGASVDKSLEDSLKLAGRALSPYPVAKNLSGVTAGVVQGASPFELGHYVVFEQDTFRAQYTCFLQSVGSSGGARISAPGPLDGPCP